MEPPTAEKDGMRPAPSGRQTALLLLGAACLATLIRGHVTLRSFDVALRQLRDGSALGGWPSSNATAGDLTVGQLKQKHDIYSYNLEAKVPVDEKEKNITISDNRTNGAVWPPANATPGDIIAEIGNGNMTPAKLSMLKTMLLHSIAPSKEWANLTTEQLKQKHDVYNNYYKHVEMAKRTKAKKKVHVDVQLPLPWSLPEVPAAMKSSQEFMEELGHLKRQHNIPFPWEDAHVHLPRPIFVLNFPKSGTTSLDKYLRCGKVQSTHTWAHYTYPGDEMVHTRIGDCLRNNFFADKATSEEVAPLHQCNLRPRLGTKRIKDRMEAFSDIGTVYPGICYYSTLHDGGLDHLVKHYSNATYILMTRDTADWYRSLKKWNGGALLANWIDKCGFGAYKYDEKYWSAFYNAHTEKIRQFAKSHLSMTYIEVELNNAKAELEKYTGISPDCFVKCVPTPGKAACPAPAPSKKQPQAVAKTNVTITGNVTDAL